jgi:hypothetical protein
MLSVRLTHFPVENNMETLNLAGTNFSYDMPTSFSNLEFLKIMGLNTIAVDDKLPALISKLPLLDDLVIQHMRSDSENTGLSWLNSLTQLKHLTLDCYNFSKSAYSQIVGGSLGGSMGYMGRGQMPLLPPCWIQSSSIFQVYINSNKLSRSIILALPWISKLLSFLRQSILR